MLLLGWLAVTLATLAILAVIYASGCWKLITNVEGFRYGLLPGSSDGVVSGADRQAGVPAPAGVPPLVRWLADRIDDLAGFSRGADGAHTRALTFGDLWAGPGVSRPSTEEFATMAADSGARVINLALMTTDLAGGRPYRLPFAAVPDPALRWQFCARAAWKGWCPTGSSCS